MLLPLNLLNLLEEVAVVAQPDVFLRGYVDDVYEINALHSQQLLFGAEIGRNIMGIETEQSVINGTVSVCSISGKHVVTPIVNGVQPGSSVIFGTAKEDEGLEQTLVDVGVELDVDSGQMSDIIDAIEHGDE